MTKLSLLCEHWSQLAQAFGQPAKGQPLPIHSLEPASFRLKRNSPAQGPTPQYRQHGSGDPGRQPQIFMLTPATVSASMTLLVYSIFIEQPVYIASMHVAGHDCGCMVCTSPSISDTSYTSVMVGFRVAAVSQL